MPAVKQKDGTWRVKKKDGTLGKRRFSTQANALAAQRGAPGKKKGTRSKKPKSKAVARTTRKSPAKKGNPAKPPQIGAAYSAGKGSVMLLAPVTDTILAGLRDGTPRAEILKRAQEKILSIPYAYNLGVIAVDAMIDRKTAQSTAITMGSASAILPEVFLASIAFDQLSGERGATPQGAAHRLHRRIVTAHQGYNPESNAIRMDHPEFRTYRALRHGGQGLRWLRSHSGIVKRITAPLARFTKMFGGRS